VGAEAKLERRAAWFHLVNVPVAGVEKVLLAKVRRWRADLGGELRMIIDHQPHPGPGCDRNQALGQAGNIIDRPILGAKLHEVCPALAELPAQFHRITVIQIGGVHKCVEQTLIERFHCSQARAQRASRLARRQAAGHFRIAVAGRMA
jgi:hypothetical protein